ncbi:MAG: hypothetical protein HYY52_03010 [Candidatus Melainabacteria bacterium]|nr:hypothetical protein [Candidatus Melainabacteria bacterium]
MLRSTKLLGYASFAVLSAALAHPLPQASANDTIKNKPTSSIEKVELPKIPQDPKEAETELVRELIDNRAEYAAQILEDFAKRLKQSNLSKKASDIKLESFELSKAINTENMDIPRLHKFLKTIEQAAILIEELINKIDPAKVQWENPENYYLLFDAEGLYDSTRRASRLQSWLLNYEPPKPLTYNSPYGFNKTKLEKILSNQEDPSAEQENGNNNGKVNLSSWIQEARKVQKAQKEKELEAIRRLHNLKK